MRKKFKWIEGYKLVFGEKGLYRFSCVIAISDDTNYTYDFHENSSAY